MKAINNQGPLESNATATQQVPVFKKGDYVVMCNCPEAEQFKGKIWICVLDSWKWYDLEVVCLHDLRGVFNVKYLQLVDIDTIPERSVLDW
jgi:hypothetical protein